ncbi:MAG: hypothetical protein VX464_11720 [Pseudomonadota bacterium]|nr:hypothetical protein [Pseudomonadota bacterium]
MMRTTEELNGCMPDIMSELELAAQALSEIGLSPDVDGVSLFVSEGEVDAILETYISERARKSGKHVPGHTRALIESEVRRSTRRGEHLCRVGGFRVVVQ